ncbi:MAG: acyltransferase [Armatimonadetes bacterium]|nr:acyltransferase [Armatimonadota bacterium]
MNAPHRSQLSSAHLDMVRGLSALAVAVGHMRSLLFVDASQLAQTSAFVKVVYFLTGFGHQAVMVFFVLSGFFVTSHIHKSMDQGKWRFDSYFVARWTRLGVALVPALVVGLALDLLGMRLFGDAGVYGSAQGFGHIIPANVAVSISPTIFLGNLFFLQTILVPTLGTNGPLWSLANEFWYYLLYPLLAMLFLRKRGGNTQPVWCVIGASAVVVVLCLRPEKAVYFLVWLLGSALAWARACPAKPARLLAWFSFVGFLAALAVGRAVKSIPELAADAVIAITFTGFVYGLMNADMRPSTKSLYVWAATKLSEISYTLYLVHVPLLVFFAAGVMHGKQLPPTLPNLAMLLPVLALVLGYAWLMWWLFERRSNDVRVFVERLMLRQAKASP